MASPLQLVQNPVGRSSGRARPAERSPRPELTVVQGRRRIASLAVFTMMLVSVAMIASVLLHTRIAERQLEIDDLNRGVASAQEAFDKLRAERAVLRSPAELSTKAAGLGMVPSAESEYVHVDPTVLARVIATTGRLPGSESLVVDVTGTQDPLDQFRLVKEIAGVAP